MNPLESDKKKIITQENHSNTVIFDIQNDNRPILNHKSRWQR